jgi:hypothetical protein
MFCSGFQARWRNLVVGLLVASSLSCSAATGTPKLAGAAAEAAPQAAATLIAGKATDQVASSLRAIELELSSHTDSDSTTPDSGSAAAEQNAEQEPATLRRLKARELNHALVKQARAIILEHNRKAPGTEFPFEVDGKRYVGRIERHFHPVGGPAKPWGWHPGCSLFAVEGAGQSVEGAQG